MDMPYALQIYLTDSVPSDGTGPLSSRPGPHVFRGSPKFSDVWGFKQSGV